LNRQARGKDDLIAGAISHAVKRGIDRICLFVSWPLSPDEIRALLAHERIAALGIEALPSDTMLPPDLAGNPRIGTYSTTSGWTFPLDARHVYFTNPRHLLSVSMLKEAQRREAASLAAYVGVGWCSMSTEFLDSAIRRYKAFPAPVRAALYRTRYGLKAALHNARHGFQRLREPQVRLDRRVPPDQALSELAAQAKPRGDYVPARVVHVAGNLAPGGAERQVTYTVSGLSKSGVESVHLLCHNLNSGERHHDFFVPAVRKANVDVREIQRNIAHATDLIAPATKLLIDCLPQEIANDVANLAGEFERLKPEAVHAWLDYDNIRAGVAAAIAGVPRIVISGRNLNPSHFAFYQPFMDAVYRTLASLPQVTIINNSRAGADDYADWIGIPRSQIKVIYNAVDFGGRSRFSRTQVNAHRQSLGMPNDAFVVGGVFRLQEEKRPFLWLETAALVARQAPHARFVIFGHGSLRDQMLGRAADLGIADRLTMPGLTDDVLSVMSFSDVILLTSRGEGTPNVLLEAQFAGTPVVTTDAGGAREAIDHGVTGYLVESAAAADIAQAVLKVAGDPGFRLEVLDDGPAFVRRKFGLERMIRETLDIYALRPR
jgi:glycosyltransferase involved in cell wall biosynthesis